MTFVFDIPNYYSKELKADFQTNSEYSWHWVIRFINAYV